MKGFIEVNNSNGTHLLNVKHIEEVWKSVGGKCTIYLAFSIPGAIDQDSISPRESYDEVKRMIEEAAELAQAALKLRRAITQTNPTPITVDEAVENLFEEYGDVVGAFWALVYTPKRAEDISELISDNINAKLCRWAERIKEARAMTDKEITAMKAVLFLAQDNPQLKRNGIWVEDMKRYDSCHKIRFEEALSIVANMLYGSGTETEARENDKHE